MDSTRKSGGGWFIQYLVANIRCLICKEPYQTEDIRLIDQRGGFWIMTVRCRQCGTQGLVFAVMPEHAVPVLASELTEEEWSRLDQLPALSIDDVLDLHDFLRDFNGDFVSLFQDSI